MNTLKASMVMVFISLLSGCSVFAVGEDPSCSKTAEGLSCHSAKEVLKMTHYRGDLENLTPEELAELQATALGKPKSQKSESNPTFSDFFKREGAITKRVQAKSEDVQKANPIDTALNVDAFNQMKMLQESEMLRDEQSIQRTESKVLRMQFATWEDDEGRLNVPGKIYVEIEKRRWISGKERVSELPVITPLQIRARSLEEIRKRKEGRE
jgi:conjugal transfer pilus assembly protein TraV